MYVNRVIEGEQTLQGPIRAPAGNFYVGTTRTGGAREFDGMIDKVKVHNRALSSEEIMKCYQMR